MDTTKEITASELIERAAKALREVSQVKAPEWASYVKTGVHKTRPPQQKDWWYSRAAAVLVAVRRLGPVGVEKLRTKYGGRQNRGMKTEHHAKGSGSIIRHVLQQLESAGLIGQNKGGRKGRVLTPKGAKFLSSLVKDESRRTEAKKGRAAGSSGTSGSADSAA